MRVVDDAISAALAEDSAEYFAAMRELYECPKPDEITESDIRKR